ncbi:MAG: DNA alkylation repair protein [Xanthomonadales bacterium]|nr:hypothetical protein [Xanthomonadales bacterium]MCC6592133.1 DNA alkylation repair protein [Xanthomonadales bacterium]
MPALAKSNPRSRAPKARMSHAEAIAALEAAGTEQNRKVYRRHGAPDPLYGVSFAHLKALLKKIGVDHELACSLWQTGNYDARNLAMKIADPKQLSRADLDLWVRGSAARMCSGYVPALACESGHGPACAQAWLASGETGLRSAGWTTVGTLAMHDLEMADDWFGERLREIESRVHTAHNDERDPMIRALIGIGCRNPALREAALAAARRIGKVDVDYGETGCKLPDAAGSIAKAWEHSLAKGYTSPAEHERAREPMRLRC